MPEAGTTHALASTKTPTASGIRFNCVGTHIGFFLTRARDGVVVFVPPIPILDETYA